MDKEGVNGIYDSKEKKQKSIQIIDPSSKDFDKINSKIEEKEE